jgi:O-antigen ligase
MSTAALVPIRNGAQRTAQWAATALGFSIPISVAFDNVLLAVVLVGWLVAGNFRETWQFVARSRTALAALILYGLLLAGTLYGERELGDIGRTLTKYIDLLFIPLFAVLLRDAAHRRLALLGFAAALVLVLALSYLVAIGVPFPHWMVVGDTGNPAVFKHYLTHGILLAYGAFLFVEMALSAATQRERTGWLAAALFAALNVMIMMQSRTGHVILVVLALYLGYCWRRWIGLAIALSAAAAIVVALTQLPGVFQERHGLAEGNRASSQASVWAKESNQQRRDYYLASLAIIKEHPLAGVGTGGFARAYAEKTRGTDAYQTRNPHNEYLHIAVQLGLIGFAALLWLFWQHWRESSRLASPLECHLSRGLLLAIAVGCLFNSLLLDHTEGLLYAWLTGILLGGLQSTNDGTSAQA